MNTSMAADCSDCRLPALSAGQNTFAHVQSTWLLSREESLCRPLVRKRLRTENTPADASGMHIRSEALALLALTRLCCLLPILIALGCWYLTRGDTLFHWWPKQPQGAT